MIDIGKKPDKTLERDLNDSHKDIEICIEALKLDITECNSGSVQERLDNNIRFIKVISAEIRRRLE